MPPLVLKFTIMCKADDEGKLREIPPYLLKDLNKELKKAPTNDGMSTRHDELTATQELEETWNRPRA